MAKPSDDQLLRATLELVRRHGTVSAASRASGIKRNTLSDRYQQALDRFPGEQHHDPKHTPGVQQERTVIKPSKDALDVTYVGAKIETPEQLLADNQIDLTLWEVFHVEINNWELGGKASRGQRRDADGRVRSQADRLWKMPLRQIKVKLRRKQDQQVAAEALLARVEAAAPLLLPIKRPKPSRQSPRRSLEICLMDPHLGMRCHAPESDKPWSLEECEEAALWALESLLHMASAYLPVEEIVFPFGNDFLHADGITHMTTAGTLQPEMESWHHVYERGERLAVTLIERMREVAPVKIYQIPGNHDRQSAFTLGRLLQAYYRQTPDVVVDASASPYKFHRYGCNLIGFEHGHSVKPIRLAALMANEVPQDWAATQGGYREWHLGDQHRKGSSKPSMLEEQGVSVEYLPGLTPPNFWHKTHSYNHQKRGAMAFVWDYEAGPAARLSVNMLSWRRPQAADKPRRRSRR